VEEGLSPGPERGGGFLGLVGQDFGVGQAGVVVHGVVQVAVAQFGSAGRAVVGDRGAAGAVASSHGAAVDLVAAAVGDVAQLLDVDVDQVCRRVVFVAADHRAGGAVQVREPGQP
jgi:hypothetical protein